MIDRRVRGVCIKRQQETDFDMPRLTETAPPDFFLGTLSNGLAVIRAFGNGSAAMTLSDVARKTGLSRASARRILLTLQELSYVESNGKLFGLRPRVLELGYAYLSSLGWLGLVHQELSALALKVRLPCSAAVLEGDEIVYVARISPEMDTRIVMSITVGQRFPAYVTALGRALLGGKSKDEFDYILSLTKLEKLTPRTIVDKKKLKVRIDKDRAQGWSFVDQEHAAGLCSVAAPLADGTKNTFAAIGVGWLAGSDSPEDVRDGVLPKLITAAQRLNHALLQFGPNLAK
jgi:IclR family pca regulon transcriptional regulator